MSGGSRRIAGNQRRVLMCPPDFFGVEYKTNPWMQRFSVDRDVAREQWTALYRILDDEIGLSVELIRRVLGLSHLVFTANAGLTIGDTFIASRFRYAERRHEEPYRNRRWSLARVCIAAIE